MRRSEARGGVSRMGRCIGRSEGAGWRSATRTAAPERRGEQTSSDECGPACFHAKVHPWMPQRYAIVSLARCLAVV